MNAGVGAGERAAGVGPIWWETVADTPKRVRPQRAPPSQVRPRGGGWFAHGLKACQNLQNRLYSHAL